MEEAKRLFLAELQEIRDLHAGLWVVAGDFNLIVEPSDKKQGVLHLEIAFHPAILIATTPIQSSRTKQKDGTGRMLGQQQMHAQKKEMKAKAQ